MAELWYALLAFTLIAYSVLDGFDLGAGIWHGLAARNESERRHVLAAIGPFWDGNEVWLIAAGGVLFLAFPRVLAAAFPAFYLALFLVLWCLMLRGVAIEVRGQFADGMWRRFWDVVFSTSSALLALLFGVAFGNLVRGLPIDESGVPTMALFTDFGATGRVGLLDYYTLSVGAFSVVLLTAHGVAFLDYRGRARPSPAALRLERWLWLAAAALFFVVSLETFALRPDLLAAMLRRPLCWLCAAIGLSGVCAVVLGRRVRRAGLTFLGSCGVISGVLGAAAAGLFPLLLRSTLNPAFSVDARAQAADGMRVGIVWWPFSFVLAVGYFVFLFRLHRGPVQAYGEHH